MIFGLTKVWFISIVIAIVGGITGGGVLLVGTAAQLTKKNPNATKTNNFLNMTQSPST